MFKFKLFSLQAVASLASWGVNCEQSQAPCFSQAPDFPDPISSVHYSLTGVMLYSMVITIKHKPVHNFECKSLIKIWEMYGKFWGNTIYLWGKKNHLGKFVGSKGLIESNLGGGGDVEVKADN